MIKAATPVRILRLTTFLRLCEVLGVEPNELLLSSSEPPARNDGMRAELRQLVAVLENADAIVIKRVTDVARWLLAGQPARPRSSGPKSRTARAPRSQRGPRRRG